MGSLVSVTRDTALLFNSGFFIKLERDIFH